MTHPTESKSPSLLADPQDPLPESNWLWRRVFVFLVLAALLAGTWFKVDTLGAIALNENESAIHGLISLLKWALALSGTLMLFYLVSPSAEQVIKMLATLSAWKSGVSTSVTSKVDTKKGTAETQTSAGMPNGESSPDAGLPEALR